MIVDFTGLRQVSVNTTQYQNHISRTIVSQLCNNYSFSSYHPWMLIVQSVRSDIFLFAYNMCVCPSVRLRKRERGSLLDSVAIACEIHKPPEKQPRIRVLTTVTFVIQAPS